VEKGKFAREDPEHEGKKGVLRGGKEAGGPLQPRTAKVKNRRSVVLGVQESCTHKEKSRCWQLFKKKKNRFCR